MLPIKPTNLLKLIVETASANIIAIIAFNVFRYVVVYSSYDTVFKKRLVITVGIIIILLILAGAIRLSAMLITESQLAQYFEADAPIVFYATLLSGAMILYNVYMVYVVIRHLKFSLLPV
jgi:hypothetical protein